VEICVRAKVPSKHFQNLVNPDTLLSSSFLIGRLHWLQFEREHVILVWGIVCLLNLGGPGRGSARLLVDKLTTLLSRLVLAGRFFVVWHGFESIVK